MKIPYFCCIGAELKRYAKDFDFMNQVYLYKVPADDTMAEVLAQDYFMAVADTVLQDDIVYIYEPTTEMLYTCHFNKQNGHITAEQMSNNIPSLTPDKILISDATGHITAGDVSLDFVKNKLTDLENNKVNINGSSTMTGPLKFKAGSFSGAIAGGLGDGISIYKLKADGTIDSEVASLTKTNGFTPGTTNAQDIGSSTLKWKDLYIARVITAVLNNGADISIPTTGGTMALTSDIKNSTVSVQLDGSAVDSFTLNQSSNKTINIPAANKDLSNLTSKGANISNWSSNVTNCITEIPQDIILEINGNNGITLKSGSKLYQPNGSGTFTPVAISGDKSRNDFSSWSSGIYMVFRSTSQYSANGGIIAVTPNNCVSGATDTSTASTHIWYDTTNNIVKLYEGGTYTLTDLSLPIAVVTITNGTGIISIDQVFNGFGYIGSNIFVLPGVKGLIPNGKKSDGTLNNSVMNVTSVQTRTFSGNETIYIILGSTGYPYWLGIKDVKYNADENINYRTDNGQELSNGVFGSFDVSSNKITYLNPKPVFHAVDYSDTEYIGHQAMPSDKHIDLTLGASGTEYTAPADGYVAINKSTTAADQYVNVGSSFISSICYIPTSGGRAAACIPVSKGQKYWVYYNAGGTTNAFKFVYENGAA